MKYDLEDMSFYDGDWVDNNKCGYGVRRYAEFDFSDWKAQSLVSVDIIEVTQTRLNEKRQTNRPTNYVSKVTYSEVPPS